MKQYSKIVRDTSVNIVKEQVVHGENRIDPYSWLRDPNWSQVLSNPSILNPRIAAHLEQENFYTKEVLQPIYPLIEKIYVELESRTSAQDIGLEIPDGPYIYYERNVPGVEHPYYCRRLRDGDYRTEEVILDIAALADGQKHVKVAAHLHSPDHRYLAWSCDYSGAEKFSIAVRDVVKHEDLSDVLHNTSGVMVWNRGSQILYYIAKDQHLRPSKVYAHTIGTSQDDDRLVYHETDTGYYLSIKSTQSGCYAVINSRAYDGNELWLIDLVNTKTATIVEPRRPDLKYDIEHCADPAPGFFLICTNFGGAENFKVVTAPVDTPESRCWLPMISHRPGCYILGQVVLMHYHVRLESIAGLKRLISRNLSNGYEHELVFDCIKDETYDLRIISGYEYNTDRLMVYYSSLRTQGCVFEYNLASNTYHLLKKQNVIGGYNSEDYISRRLFATSLEGERIPLSLVYHRETKLDGTAPVFLYGYGAYGYNVEPVFSPDIFSLVNRGFIYAIAHVRGGMELGCHWHTGGKLGNKMNSFSDFIVVAEYLIKHNYTSRGNITAHGISAGGTVVAAAANIAPGLFRSVIAEVPFVDVLNTLLDEDLPLTPSDWIEWGNPSADPDIYQYISTYSPYDNIESQDYPHVLALCGLTDYRVGYWEPAKWIAQLRHMQTNHSVVLLKTDMAAGHSGPSSLFSRFENLSLIYAFVISLSDNVTQFYSDENREAEDSHSSNT